MQEDTCSKYPIDHTELHTPVDQDMTSETFETVRYELAMAAWEDQGPLHILDQRGQKLLVVPVAFLARSGVADNVKYITEQVLTCYECAAGYLSDDRGNEVAHADTLKAGSLTFIRTDNSSEPLRPRGGPRFKYRWRAPVEGGDSSTMSNSRRSSVNQSRFREAVRIRDQKCLVSDEHYTECTACHIIPQSRPEYYSEILGYDPGNYFRTSYGLLLLDGLHHSFDRGEWALYPQGDDLIVHMFRPSNAKRQAYHGKVITPSRFGTSAEEQPDRRLLRFHYHQCAMMRLRGFWIPTA